MRWITTLVILGTLAASADALEVYQDLDEATERIERLKDRPYAKLIDADGFYQSDTLIFKDTQTGCEIWSLTMEACVEMANIERRMVYSADGSVFSIKSNRAEGRPRELRHHRCRPTGERIGSRVCLDGTVG